MEMEREQQGTALNFERVTKEANWGIDATPHKISLPAIPFSLTDRERLSVTSSGLVPTGIKEHTASYRVDRDTSPQHSYDIL
jgi:hypothetical protein